MVTTAEGQESVHVNHRFLVPRLSLIMFMQFFIWGSWSVTLGLMMIRYEISLLTGDAFSTGPITPILSPLVLGMLVDRFFASQEMIAVVHLAGMAILWLVPQMLVTQDGTLLIDLLFGYTLYYIPTLALTSNIAFHSLANIDKAFPAIRVLGTAGWIIAGTCIGVTGIFDTTDISTSTAFCSMALTICSLTLPHTPTPAKGIPVQFRDLLRADAFMLLKTRRFLIFLPCTTLVFIPLGAYHTYTASYLADVGVKDVNAAMSFGQMSKIAFMLVIPLLFRRPRVECMPSIDMAAWFARYAFFAFGVNEERRFLPYLGTLLHGVYYDFFFVVDFIYTDRVMGEKVKGQAQSMIVMFTYEIDTLPDSQISGALYNHLVVDRSVSRVWATFWRIPAVAAAVIALIFLFSF